MFAGRKSRHAPSTRAETVSAATTPTAAVSADEAVPAGLRIAGAFGWRLLIVAAVLALFGYVVAQLRLIAIPFFVAILLAALLVPFVGWLVRHRWPKWLAVTTAMLTLIGAVAGLVTLVITQVRAEAPELYERSLQAYDQFAAFLLDSPLHLTEADIAGYTDQIVQAVQRDSQVLLSGAITVGSTAGHLLAGTLLTLFATLFMLIDGKSIWRWTVGLFPRKARVAVDGAGTSGWITLTTFVKVQIFVAFIDAVGIGLGAWILGLVFGGFPLVIPIAIAVFLGSFIPIVGAVATGALAVVIALVYLGPLPAIIMLGIVLLVQQVEGHILQPLVMGSAVKVHPLAVIFAVAAGSFLAGIPGALFAVPVIAVVNVIVRYIADGRWRDRTGLDPRLRDAV